MVLFRCRKLEATGFQLPAFSLLVTFRGDGERMIFGHFLTCAGGVDSLQYNRYLAAVARRCTEPVFLLRFYLRKSHLELRRPGMDCVENAVLAKTS